MSDANVIQNSDVANTAANKPEKKGFMINKSNIVFDKQFFGYSISQVDKYVNHIAEAYQSAYIEYQDKCDINDRLLETNKRLERRLNASPDLPAPTAPAVTAVAATAPTARDIVGEPAIQQAVQQGIDALVNKIIDEARVEAKKILDEAYLEQANVKKQTQKLLERAKKESDIAKEKAKLIISGAYAYAAGIKKSPKNGNEQSDETIAQTVNDMQDFLARRPARGASA